MIDEIMSQSYLDDVLKYSMKNSYSESVCDYLNEKFSISRLTAFDEDHYVVIIDNKEQVYSFDIYNDDYYTSLKEFLINYELLLKLELLG